MAFQFDTSGVVYVLVPGCATERPRVWTDLDAFTQGYVEVLLQEINAKQFGDFPVRRGHLLGFSNIASETLARIMEDCAHAQNVFQGLGFKTRDIEGRRFYNGRNDGSLTGAFGVAYPPLTPYLGHDSCVYLREGR